MQATRASLKTKSRCCKELDILKLQPNSRARACARAGPLPKRIPTPEPKPKPKPKPEGGLEGGPMIGDIAMQAVDLPPKRCSRPPNPTHTHDGQCIKNVSRMTVHTTRATTCSQAEK
ncbi:hypothetical protein RSOL_226400, partial [Rhizoctonia solani AG-3 Rhs1AP]